MYGPPDKQMGRGMWLFAALMLVLALWMSLGRGEWSDAVLWYGVAIFCACFGGLLGDVREQWHRPLLVIGLIAGVVAFAGALRAVGVALW
jgi:asparagine N-glycosylation enzyme membrane subunit Stt3